MNQQPQGVHILPVRKKTVSVMLYRETFVEVTEGLYYFVPYYSNVYEDD